MAPVDDSPPGPVDAPEEPLTSVPLELELDAAPVGSTASVHAPAFGPARSLYRHPESQSPST